MVRPLAISGIDDGVDPHDSSGWPSYSEGMWLTSLVVQIGSLDAEGGKPSTAA
jgi:hypothetical protein